MRLLFFSDVHGDKATAGMPRFDDAAAAVEQVVRHAVDTQVDRVIFCGDWSNPDSQRCHACARLAVETVLELDKHGIGSDWVTGNHDVIEDGSGESSLSALVGLRRGGNKVRARVFDRPVVDWLRDVSLVVLPFTARTHRYDPVEFIRAASVGEGPIVVVGHLNLEGIFPGSEVTKFPRGREVFWPVKEIRRRWGSRAVMVGGHIHRAQEFAGVHIVGSLLRLAFDEEDNEPSFLELGIDA